VKSTVQNVLGPDGRSLIVAMDHARDWGPLPGLERPEEVIARVIEGGADGIMTTYGVAKQYGHLMAGRVKVIVRLDGWASHLRESWLAYTGWQGLYTVEDALRVGADAVIVNYFMGIAAEHDSLRVLARSAAAADRLDVPLVVESLPCPSPQIAEPNNPAIIAVAARIATEHGADLIKCYYSGTTEGFRQVTETNVAPVLIAGGAVMNTPLDVLEVVHGALAAGARGVFFGNNIWRAPDPTAMVRAMRSVIHDGVSPRTAAESLMALA
jgi:DhnA family fructose-bisphosphate aldolase class Ia